MVCRRTERSILAVSRGQALGVLAAELPSGVLVAAFGRPHLAHEVVPQLEGICEALRRP